MKNLLHVFFALLSLNAFSQDIKYSDLIDNNVKKNTFKVYKSYLSKDELNFKSGDTLKVGFPSSDKSFAFITLSGDGINKSESNIKIVIVNFLVVGTKKTGYQATAVCKTGVFITKYQVQMENAIASGEIKTSLLSSDEALTELKKAKEKLELGLMTQAKYDSLKIEYSKIIK